jgi:hypothetical protein
MELVSKVASKKPLYHFARFELIQEYRCQVTVYGFEN